MTLRESLHAVEEAVPEDAEANPHEHIRATAVRRGDGSNRADDTQNEEHHKANFKYHDFNLRRFRGFLNGVFCGCFS